MKYLVVALLMLSCVALMAESAADSLVAENRSKLGIWAFGEFGVGHYSGVGLRSVQGGLAFKLHGKIMVKGYALLYTEDVQMFDDAKYEFLGFGMRIGPVFRKNKVSLSPTIGLESGTIRIGEGDYIDGFIGAYYTSYRKEDIIYVPISLELQAQIGRIMQLTGRAFVAVNKDYPVFGLGFGIGLGWM